MKLNSHSVFVFQPKRIKERNVVDILSDSLKDLSLEVISGEHSSIQGDVRYQLVIDSSADESLSRFLFTFKILDRTNTKVFVCSSLPGDVHGMVCLFKVLLAYTLMKYLSHLCRLQQYQKYDMLPKRGSLCYCCIPMTYKRIFMMCSIDDSDVCTSRMKIAIMPIFRVVHILR